MEKNYKNLIMAVLVIFFLFFVFNLSFAANTFVYPWSNPDNGIPGLINRLYLVGLGLAGGSAFVVLIWGAILYTISGAVDKKTEAKEWIKGAIYGLILLLGAYLILYTINPDLVNMRFVLPTLDVPASGQQLTYQQEQQLAKDAEGIGGMGLYSQDAAAATLMIGGVTVLPGVKLNNVRGAVVNELKNLEKNIVDEYYGSIVTADNPQFQSGKVVVTSITGGDHAQGVYSHANGWKADIVPNEKVDDFIKNSGVFRDAGIRKDVDGRPLTVYERTATDPTTGAQYTAQYVFEPKLTYIDSSGKTVNRNAHIDIQLKPKS